MPSANSNGAAVNHFISSNSTTQHFLGAAQRGWMTSGGGSNVSLSSSPALRPVAARLNTSSAPDLHLQDPSTTLSATRHHPTESPGGPRAVQIEQAPVPNVRWASVNTSEPAPARKRSFETAFTPPGPPATSPLARRQQPLPVSSTTATAATSTSLSSTDGITTQTLPRLKTFLDQIRLQGPLNDLVSCRFTILKDACICHDTFYLCLHQIYCRATTDPLFTMQIGFGDEQLHGFEAMQTILLSNGALAPEVLGFFAAFPYPDPAHATPIPGHIVAQVRAFLSSLDREWQELRRVCSRRGYPPFTDELRAWFRLGSPVFQKVLFNSIHRDLIGTDSPLLAEQGLGLFDENQRLSQERLATTGHPPSYSQVQAEVQQLGSRYLNLRSALQRTRAEIPSVSSSPVRDGNTKQNQQAQVTTPVTGAFPGPTLPRQSMAAHTWSPDWPRPSRVGQPLDQRYPRVDHMQHPQAPRPYPAMETEQRHLQHLANTGSHGQQAEAMMWERPPSVLNRQVGRSPESPAPPVRRMTSHNPTRNMSSGGVPSVTATAPPGAPDSTWKSDQLDTAYPPFLPPLGYQPIQGINQDYRVVALHQAHLRSPKYQAYGVQSKSQSSQRLYQVPISFLLLPQVLGYTCPYFSWQFHLSADHLRRSAKDVLVMPDARDPSLTEPVRQVTNGSCLYRLKCVEVPARPPAAFVPEHVWVTLDTVWPTGGFFAINDIQLELRRKGHHGKDLAVDLTKYVKEGLNTLTCSLLRTMGEMKVDRNFAVAIEAVEIIEHGRIKELPFLLNEADAKDAVTRSLNGALYGKANRTDTGRDKEEDEVLIMDAHISIDVTDPYTARIFELPVRGKTCPHRECFDLHTFLGTRKARTSDKDRDNAPTSPDEWKCPICKRDARPQSLVVDGFLQQVRKDLEEKDQLDVKAIKVQANGSWEPVLDRKKPLRRGSNNTDDADGFESRRPCRPGSRPGVPLERWMGQRLGEVASAGSCPVPRNPVVIELD